MTTAAAPAAEVLIFCDGCPAVHRARYPGATPRARYTAARAHLAGQGWLSGGGRDLCPDCRRPMN